MNLSPLVREVIADADPQRSKMSNLLFVANPLTRADHPARHPSYLRIGIVGHVFFYQIGFEHGVVIQKHYNLPLRFSYSQIPRGGGVGSIQFEIANPSLYLFQILFGGRGVLFGLIDHDHFVRRIILFERQIYGLTQHLFPVVGGDDDADLNIRFDIHAILILGIE